MFCLWYALWWVEFELRSISHSLAHRAINCLWLPLLAITHVWLALKYLYLLSLIKCIKQDQQFKLTSHLTDWSLHFQRHILQFWVHVPWNGLSLHLTHTKTILHTLSLFRFSWMSILVSRGLDSSINISFLAEPGISLWHWHWWNFSAIYQGQ